MKKFLILLKWKYSRWIVKRRHIRFHILLVRIHWIQELENLPQYNLKELGNLRYSKLRKLFIKEFPNEYIHNPFKD